MFSFIFNFSLLNTHFILKMEIKQTRFHHNIKQCAINNTKVSRGHNLITSRIKYSNSLTERNPSND